MTNLFSALRMLCRPPRLLAILCTFPLIACSQSTELIDKIRPKKQPILVSPQDNQTRRAIAIEEGISYPDEHPLSMPRQPIQRPNVRPPAVAAQRVIVIDALTGRSLYEKNADERCAVASTQKLVTALTIEASGSMNDPVTITNYDTLVEPTKLYLKPGEVYTRRDLVKALVVKSGNDAGRALARDVSGSDPAFGRRMTAYARSIGMTNSNFVNAHGLTELGQYSTARDMAKCALVAYRKPWLRQYMTTKAYGFRYPNGKVKTLESTNRLMKKNPWVTGMKTGTTNLSGRCLVCSGQYQGRHAIAVVLKSNSANIWSDSENLLKWALGRP